MRKDKAKAIYESPSTRRTQVNLESGVCASSKEKVVSDDNTTVTIDRQGEGGDFTISSWD